MKTLLVPQVALAALALAPALVAQHPASGSGLVEFTKPAAAPRVRFTAAEEPPKLGVMVSETDDGVLISDVFDGSLASRAGVTDGDILFKIGDSRINDVADIPAALAATAKAKAVSITVIRPGEGLVTLKARQAAPAPKKAEGNFFVTSDANGGFLGVELGEGTSNGVTIDGVIDNSAAWFAGLEDGDVLISVNGDAVNTAEDVSAAIGSKSAGTKVKLVYSRNGEKQTAKVKLGERTPAIQNPMGNMLFSGPDGQDGPHGLFFGEGGMDGGNFVFDHEGLSGDGGTFVIDGNFDGDFDWTELSEEMGEWTEDDGQLKLHLKLDGDHLKGLHELDGDHAAQLHKALKGMKLGELKGLKGQLKGLKGMQLGELKELKGLKGQLHGLHELKELEGLHELHELKGLKGQLHGLHELKELKGLEGLHGLKIIESLDGLNGLNGMHIIESMGDGDGEVLSIKIEDGVMTIDRDGEIEVIELDGENTFIKEIGFAPDGQQIKVMGNAAGISGNVIKLECSDTATECQADLAECNELIATVSTTTTTECADAVVECTVLAECADAAVECVVVTECADAIVECAVELADSEQVAAECAVECAEQVALATEVSFITADVQAAQAQIIAVSAECAAAAAECSAEAAAECADVAAECADAAAECADAAAECADASAECADAAESCCSEEVSDESDADSIS